jgi:hypothetical protein
MAHPFHAGRYSGATTIPRTNSVPVPAAALVLHFTRCIPINPMFKALDNPDQRGVAGVRLVPVSVVDFYARRNALPDLHELGSEELGAGNAPARAGGVRARAAVAVQATGGELQQVQGSGGRDGGCSPAVGGETC